MTSTSGFPANVHSRARCSGLGSTRNRRMQLNRIAISLPCLSWTVNMVYTRVPAYRALPLRVNLFHCPCWLPQSMRMHLCRCIHAIFVLAQCRNFSAGQEAGCTPNMYVATLLQDEDQLTLRPFHTRPRAMLLTPWFSEQLAVFLRCARVR